MAWQSWQREHWGFLLMEYQSQVPCRHDTDSLLPAYSRGCCPSGHSGHSGHSRCLAYSRCLALGAQQRRLTWMYLKSMSALSSVASSWSSLFLSLPERSSLSMNLATSSAGLHDAMLAAMPSFVQACKKVLSSQCLYKQLAVPPGSWAARMHQAGACTRLLMLDRALR